VASLQCLSERELVYDSKLTAIWLSSSNFSSKVSTDPRRGKRNISYTQGFGLQTGFELRTLCYKPNKKFSYLVLSNRNFTVAISQKGSWFVKGYKSFDITCIGTFYEKLLEIVWFFRQLFINKLLETLAD
jgi:hypothetical protein